MTTAEYSLGPFTEAVDARLREWAQTSIASRMWTRDHTVWSPEPLAELTDRLGWLELPYDLDERIPELIEFAAEVAGFRHVVLLGMGGSSLAPEVFAATFGTGSPELIVLDSTHPEAIRAVVGRIEPLKTLFVVASKSGSTVETMSLASYFFDKVSGSTSEPGTHFVALTDPNSDLERLAFEHRYRKTFFTPPAVGGRYSALTDFGMVPAAIVGTPIAALAVAAQAMADSCKVDSVDNPGLQLGAALAELALAGRDKVTFSTSSGLAAFPAWIEQLIAESTGKEGVGIIPIADEPPRSDYGDDRVFVSYALAHEGHSRALDGLAAAGHPIIRITLDVGSDIAAEMYRMEFATAAAGAALG
ncbi:MAG: phosphoheptose isomerase, partial [Acidimicrobiia bacterium]|nr:phosphoheptose isomerase [Acidimicrobiia bacterium]